MKCAFFSGSTVGLCDYQYRHNNYRATIWSRGMHSWITQIKPLHLEMRKYRPKLWLEFWKDAGNELILVMRTGFRKLVFGSAAETYLKHSSEYRTPLVCKWNTLSSLNEWNKEANNSSASQSISHCFRKFQYTVRKRLPLDLVLI